MAIKNFICDNCKKTHVCKWYNKVYAFSEEKKNPIGVTIEIKECEEFEEIN